MIRHETFRWCYWVLGMITLYYNDLFAFPKIFHIKGDILSHKLLDIFKLIHWYCWEIQNLIYYITSYLIFEEFLVIFVDTRNCRKAYWMLFLSIYKTGYKFLPTVSRSYLKNNNGLQGTGEPWCNNSVTL